MKVEVTDLKSPIALGSLMIDSTACVRGLWTNLHNYLIFIFKILEDAGECFTWEREIWGYGSDLSKLVCVRDDWMNLFVSGIVNEPASNLFGGLAVLLWYKLKASHKWKWMQISVDNNRALIVCSLGSLRDAWLKDWGGNWFGLQVSVVWAYMVPSINTTPATLQASMIWSVSDMLCNQISRL